MEMPLPPTALRFGAERILALTPGRRRGVLVLAGALAALALPPVHAIPLLWLALPLLLLLLGRAPDGRRAFATGWWFGVGFFIVGLYWIAHAFLVNPWRHAWLIPFALGALGAGLGLFTGVSTWAAWRLAPRRPLARVLALAATWTLLEWVRSWLFTGFPWNLLATVWMPLDVMLQPAAWIGAFGLSLATVLAAGLPVLLLEGRRGLPALAASAALLAGLGGWGALRLDGASAGMVADVRLRLVQPAIEQASKWARDRRLEHVQQQITLSRAEGFDKITHVIWAETSVPYYVDADVNARVAVATAAPPGGVVIVGAARRTPIGQDPVAVWNSLFAVDSQGSIVAAYDKVHLVPFGEYMPLRAIVPAGIEKMTDGSIDFSFGEGRTTLPLPGAPSISPLICYEIIFPGEVLGPGERPGWIVNLTNDGWFGISSGPYQHFAAARLRAVEEGLPVIRVANTGISAVIDSHGRVRARLGLGERGFVDSDLPQALPPTAYARWGAAVPLLLVVLAALAGGIAARWRR